MRRSGVVLCVLALVLVGCGGPKLTWRQKMESSAGVERVQGVMAVGEQNRWRDIPRVIERLDDNDESVRLMAARTLQEMTGENFGYKTYAPEHERREAARRWRNWWNTTGRYGRKAARAKAGG